MRDAHLFTEIWIYILIGNLHIRFEKRTWKFNPDYQLENRLSHLARLTDDVRVVSLLVGHGPSPLTSVDMSNEPYGHDLQIEEFES